MSMSLHDPASQSALDSTLKVTAIDISLAENSHGRVESVKLRKNGELLQDVHGHRIEFSPSLVLGPEDHISVSVNCSRLVSSTWIADDIVVDIHLRDIESMDHGQGMISYRKQERDVEVMITGYHSLVPATTLIIQSCERFRLLIIGNSGVGKSSLLDRVFGVKGIHTSTDGRGIADINQEFVAETNNRFVVHDSLGFESGDDRNMEIVQDFVKRRNAMPRLKDQLHAVWLCLELPYAGGRLLEGCAETFLQRRREILGDVPLIVVLTKADQLDVQLQIDPPDGDVEQYKLKYLNKHCIEPLHKATEGDFTYVPVSVQDGYSKSFPHLVKATIENMAKYHVNEAPRVVASIAQRVSIRDKIELSIAIGEKEYKRMLFNNGALRGHTLQDYLQVIRADIVNIWNFNDPDQYLIGNLPRTDKLVGTSTSEPSSIVDSFTNSLTSALEHRGSLLRSGGGVLPGADATAGVTSSVAQPMYEACQTDRSVNIFIGYMADLICFMQGIFLLASGYCDALPPYTVTLKVLPGSLDGQPCSDHLLDEFRERHGTTNHGMALRVGNPV